LKTDEYLCYFNENPFKETVSSLIYNFDKDVLVTSNGTRHFTNYIEKENEISANNQNESCNKDLIQSEEDSNREIDDPYLPSYYKIWKFNTIQNL